MSFVILSETDGRDGDGDPAEKQCDRSQRCQVS